MKKIIYFFVVAIVSSFGILLFSCGIDDKDGENALKFNKTEVSVVETFETVVLLENQGDAQVVWTVKDSDIASVNDGIIKGLKAGETVVSATVGTKSVSCDVIVTPINENLFSFVPEKSNYALGIGAEKVLSGKLYYNDILINSDSVTYESNDSAIATISGDKVTAVKAGEVSIVVSAVYYGHTIKATINFVISSDYNIDISNGKINLYSLAEYDGKVYKNSETLNAVVQHQGQQVSADTIQWSVKDSAVCEINGNTVTAKRTGKTEITAKYIIDANNFVEDSVIIEIDPIEAESDIAAIDIDAESGYYLIDTDLLFGGNEVIIEKAELQDDQLIIEIPYESESGRLILDSQFAMFSGENAIRLYTDKISLKFNVYIWTKVIKTPADLQVLSLATYGHYKLGNDISLASADPLSGGDYVFTGVFDGCGYTISYLQVEEAGLFTTVGNGAIIKNLKLTNAQISSDAEKVGVLIKTVKKDSSITLSNIEAEIINKGECSGGFIGVTESNTEVNLNDINAYVYSDGTEERGAVLGASAGSLKTSGEITIYSSAKICGEKQDSANETYYIINGQYFSIYPVEYGEPINSYQTADTVAVFDVYNVSSAILYGAVKRAAGSSGSITVTADDYAGIYEGGIEIRFTLNNGETVYYVIPIVSELHITQENYQELKNAKCGTIYVDEDITLSGKWQSTASFNGTMDGQGHTISGLDIATSGALFKYLSGTVKDISVVNVKFTDGWSGVFGVYQRGNLTFENVFVSVLSVPAKFGQGGLIERNTNSNYKTIVKNCYVEICDYTKTDDNEVGFISGFNNVNYQIENCVFVGASGYLFNGRTVLSTAENYKAYESIFEADENELPTEFIKEQFNKYNKIFNLTKDNFDDLKDATKIDGVKFIVLQEDVVFETRKVWSTNVSFSGTFIGNGHKISGLEFKTQTIGDTKYYGGLFKSFAGTIKDVAILNIKLGYGGNMATIAYSASGTINIDNVLVQISDMDPNGAWRGGIVERGGKAENISNAVICFEVDTNPENCGYISGHNGGTASLTNVYMVGNSTSTRTAKATSGSLSVSGTNTTPVNKDDFKSGVTGGTITLTAQVAAWATEIGLLQ